MVLLRDLAPAVEYGLAGRILVFVFLVGVPFLALLQPDERELGVPPRRALYLSAVIGVAILTGLALAVLWLEAMPLARIGLRGVEVAAFVLWTALAGLGALAGDFLVTRLAARLGLRESRLTFLLMPTNRAELAAFFGVSLCAGFGEELTYHGFLLAGLAGWLKSGWLAAVVANLAFGILHGYQGPAGVLRAFVMGYVLALPVVVGAGLWPAMAAHFLVNAALGLGLWRWMLPPARPEA